MSALDRFVQAEQALRAAREELRARLLASPDDVANACEAVRVATVRLEEARVGVQREESVAKPDEWRPPHAAHVIGQWTRRRFDGPLPVAQTVTCRCEVCGASWSVQCSSGLPRMRVQQFALGHLHRDVLAVSPHARKAP